MFKEIFNRLIAVIFKPSEAWEALSRKEESTETFLSRFVYPLFGLIALSAFLGVLFTRKEFDFQIALKSSIKILVASMGGFFLGAYLLNELWRSVFKQPRDIKLIHDLSVIRLRSCLSSLSYWPFCRNLSFCGCLSSTLLILCGWEHARI